MRRDGSFLNLFEYESLWEFKQLIVSILIPEVNLKKNICVADEL